MHGNLETRQLTKLVKGLELHYSPKIPVQEYLGVMSEHDTERVQALVQELLGGGDTTITSCENGSSSSTRTWSGWRERTCGFPPLTYWGMPPPRRGQPPAEDPGEWSF